MSDAAQMLTLAQMQKSLPEELRSIALHTPSRFYSLACEQMAHAMDAHVIGDKPAMLRHVEAAKRAHARACEDEHGQCLRVRQTAEVIGARQ